MKVGTLILMRGKLKQMFTCDKIRYGDMNRRSITNCRWRFFSGKLSYLLLVLFQVSLSSLICQSLCFHLLGRGKRLLCIDMHVFTTGERVRKKEIKIKEARLRSNFGSIVFSSVFHLWKKNQWGDILYEVSHSDYEMPRAFPTVVLCTWYKQDPNQDKTVDMKVKLSSLH